MTRDASRYITQRDEVALIRAELNRRHFDMRRVTLWPDTLKLKREAEAAKGLHDEIMKAPSHETP